MKTPKRSIAIAAGIVVIAGVSWLGLAENRKRNDCKKRSAAFSREIETIKRDAQEQLKIGANKADVARFFAEHDMRYVISEFDGSGTLKTAGCAPFFCGSDSALIGVRVKLSAAGTVAAEPIVMNLYTDCL